MPRVKEKRKCANCGSEFNRHNGNTKAKYCSRLCACRVRNTESHQTKAGIAGGIATGKKKFKTGVGYVKINGRHEHRLEVEKAIGRRLTSDEIVHHIDSNKKNNKIENLVILTRNEHARIHFKKRV